MLKKPILPKPKIEIIECECGCGGKLEAKDSRGRSRRFLPYHYTKTEEHKSKVQSVLVLPRKREHIFRNGVEGKVCTRCREWQPLLEYHASKGTYDNLQTRCKQCTIIITKKYCDKNRESINARARTPERRARNNARVNQRMEMHTGFRILNALRCRLRDALKRTSTKKTHHTIALLGCSISKFKTHLQSLFQPGMTWDNYGRIDGIRCWELDHIRPCASFDLADSQQQKECFHYTNLQPLWASENRCKSDSWEE